MDSSWRDSPLYVVWADDNAVGTDFVYSIDNVQFTPAVGQSLAPEFGQVGPDAFVGFDASDSLQLEHCNAGRIVVQADAGFKQDNRSLAIRDATALVRTQAVDLRLSEGPVVASLDVKTANAVSWLSGFTTFESIHAVCEYSLDGLSWSTIDIVPLLRGAPILGVGTDELQPLNNGQLGAFTHFAASVPAGAQSARIRVDADVGSGSEFYFDNFAIFVVPEPTSMVLMFGCLSGLLFCRLRLN